MQQSTSLRLKSSHQTSHQFDKKILSELQGLKARPNQIDSFSVLPVLFKLGRVKEHLFLQRACVSFFLIINFVTWICVHLLCSAVTYDPFTCLVDFQLSLPVLIRATHLKCSDNNRSRS